MARAEFFSPVHSPIQQRPLPALPHEDRVDETCRTASTRLLRKQSHVRAAPADTRDTGVINSYEIHIRSQEHREQRKLRRVANTVKTQGSVNLFGPKSPGKPHTSNPRSPSYAVEDITNYLNAPNKLIRKSSKHSVPNGWYQPNSSAPTIAPAGSCHTSCMQESHTPKSESRGEIQRQLAISKRLQRKHRAGSPNPVEVGAYLGALERIHDGDGWVDGFRLEVEKPLQRVYTQRLQRGSFVIPEKSKKVRFAPVVECCEF